jgi:hypothetical protein
MVTAGGILENLEHIYLALHLNQEEEDQILEIITSSLGGLGCLTMLLI